MSGSFSQQLEDLLNPLPKFEDPEDDGDEATKAKVSERFDEDDGHEEGGVGLSALRRRNTTLLLETDSRYKGKAVSRKELLMEESEDEDDEEDEEEEEGSVEEQEDDEEGDSSGDEEEKSLEDWGEEQYSGAQERNPSKMKDKDLRFPQGVDFQKLTEGMDDLGVSEEEDDDSGEDSDGDESIDEDKVDDETEDVDGGERAISTFSQEKVDEEVEKGKAVKNQLALWDQLLEGRIKIQKALVTANQLPQPVTFPEFKRRGGVEMAGALKNSHKALKALQRSLLELHDQLLHQSSDTRSILLKTTDGAQSDEDHEEVSMQETGPAKRKLEMAEYPSVAAKRFAAFRPYCNATLQKWHDKTRLTMGRSSRGFGAFDRNIVTQVEQVLMDKERLVRRTQTRRSEYRVLGKKEAAAVVTDAAPGEGQEAERQMKANTHLKDLDEDIFDDNDFYHQLLRELIERKTSAADPNDQVAMGRQWLAIQKLRSKIKKKVDTKASKGRKVRFQVHSKLVNFMAPMDHSSMSDEARSELYRGLFGQSSSAPSRE